MAVLVSQVRGGSEGVVPLFFLRAFVAAIVMLPPAILMGATLPLMLRHVSGVGTASFPRLYGINTLGAVVGALSAGFVLVAALGETATLLAAAAVNAGLGLLAVFADGGERAEDGELAAPGGAIPRRLLWLSFSAGFLTLCLEIVWFRLLGLTVGGSAQALSLLLAAFLVGLGLGSVQAHRETDDSSADLEAAYAHRMLRVATSAALLLPLSAVLPVLVVKLLARTDSLPWVGTAVGGSLAILMGYGTWALGGSLPLLVERAGRLGTEGGRGTGVLYAASSAGSIAAALLTTFVAVPTLGIDGTSVLACGLAVAAAGLAQGRSVVPLGLAITVLSLITPYLYRHPGGLFVLGTYAYAYTHRDAAGVEPSVPPGWARYSELVGRPLRATVSQEPPEAATTWIWRRDGITASVAVGEAGGVRSLVINGKTDASSYGPGDMRTQLLLGHLPALFRAAEGGRALGIGLGSGTTVTSLERYRFSEVVSAEVEPAVMEAAEFFSDLGGGIPASGVRSVLDDGRQVLSRDRERFSVITSEPSNLWMAGVAHLFTREFFELARDRLAEGGVFCQWLHLYQIGIDDVRMLLRTMGDVFPRMAVFADGPDLLILAGEEGCFAEPEDVARRFASPRVRDHLALGQLNEIEGVLSTYLGDEGMALRFAGAGPLNTDDRPYLEFEAPRSILRDDSAAILQSLRAAGSASGEVQR